MIKRFFFKPQKSASELQQTFLAKLYTQKSFRDHFLENPESVGLSNGINAVFCTELAGSKRASLLFFAASLIEKRSGITSGLLPVASKIYGETFKNHYREYAADRPLSGSRKYFKDARGFTAFLLQNAPPENPDLLDMLRFENLQMRIKSSGSPFLWLSAGFGFPPKPLGRAFVRGENMPEKIKSRVFYARFAGFVLWDDVF